MSNQTTIKNWLDIEISLFKCPADNFGRVRTFRDIFRTDFGMEHEWFFKVKPTDKEWISGTTTDLKTIISIRKMVADDPQKVFEKQKLQCYTPSAFYSCKKKGKEELNHYNPILQLDFDKLDNFDIDEVKKAIFDLPFVCCVSKSVSGNGLFALVLIEEPELLRKYAEQCFEVFEYLELPVDTSKGRNYSDLRFVSYDSNILCKTDPTPLKIKRFHTSKKEVTRNATTTQVSNDKLINWAIRLINQATIGHRFETVRKVAYTLGGYGLGLSEIKEAINNSGQYRGVESKYLTHADECFAHGQLKPIAHG